MKQFITSYLLIFILIIKSEVSGLESSEERETISKSDLNLFEVLQKKHLEHEEAYEQFKSFVSPPSSLARINFKMSALLQVLSIQRLTHNFISVIRILEGDMRVIDSMLILTRDLVRGVILAISESRAPLATEIGNPKYLDPVNFHLVKEMVDEAYDSLMKLKGEAFTVYVTGLDKVVKEFELPQEKADALGHNVGLLQEGLFISYERVKALEMRLYEEVVFPQKD